MKKDDIFISYRHSSYHIAKLVHTYLHSANYKTFLDFERLESGPFNTQLYSVIENCKDFILILTPNDLDRCHKEDDWIKKEVCHAIKHKKNIIPLFFNDFQWPQNMSKELDPLSTYLGIPVTNLHFDYEIQILKKKFIKSKPKANPVKLLLYTAIAIIAIFSIIDSFKSKEAIYPTVAEKEDVNYSDPLVIASMDTIILNKYGKDKIIDTYIDAKRGNSDAQCNIGKICYDSENYKDALYWFSLSAKQGNFMAANELGRCYYNANGVTRSPRNALNWFLVSARGNCPEGLNNAGKCYYEGYGTNVPDVEKAFNFFSMAANAQCVSAQFNLGQRYFNGEGVEKSEENIRKGIEWLERAANNGSPMAQARLGEIYSNGINNVEIDYIKAEKWLNKAIDSNDPKVSLSAEKILKKMHSQN